MPPPLTVRMAPDERAAVERNASKFRYSLSSYIRYAVCYYMEKHGDDPIHPLETFKQLDFLFEDTKK